jgi:hypothetical protein
VGKLVPHAPVAADAAGGGAGSLCMDAWPAPDLAPLATDEALQLQMRKLQGLAMEKVVHAYQKVLLRKERLLVSATAQLLREELKGCASKAEQGRCQAAGAHRPTADVPAAAAASRGTSAAAADTAAAAATTTSAAAAATAATPMDATANEGSSSRQPTASSSQAPRHGRPEPTAEEQLVDVVRGTARGKFDVGLYREKTAKSQKTTQGSRAPIAPACILLPGGQHMTPGELATKGGLKGGKWRQSLQVGGTKLRIGAWLQEQHGLKEASPQGLPHGLELDSAGACWE